jgi:hypothetical protein
MSFFQRLFGNPASTSLSEPSKRDAVHPSLLKYRTFLASIAGIGLPDHPLRRQGYDPISGMPCMDFSLWVADQLREKDYVALWFFVAQWNRNLPPSCPVLADVQLEDILSISISEDHKITLPAARQYLRDQIGRNERKLVPETLALEVVFYQFIQKNFQDYITTSAKAILDLQTFYLIHNGISSVHRPFWIVDGREAFLLSRILSIYPISPKIEACNQLVSQANQFLKEMKGEDGTEYWKTVPMYHIRRIQKVFAPVTFTDLTKKLEMLGLGERLHFFDYASQDAPYWSGNSSFQTRKVGLIEAQSLEKMIDLGLFHRCEELEAIPYVMAKSELKDRALAAGFTLKKSWTMDKIHSSLMSTDQGRAFLQAELKSVKPVRLNSIYQEDVKNLLAYQAEILTLIELLAMF